MQLVSGIRRKEVGHIGLTTFTPAIRLIIIATIYI